MEFLAGKSVNISLGRHKRGLENDIKIDVCVCACVRACEVFGRGSNFIEPCIGPFFLSFFLAFFLSLSFFLSFFLRRYI